MRLFEEAIRAARENGFVQNEDIANELAAWFYLDRAYETIGHAAEARIGLDGVRFNCGKPRRRPLSCSSRFFVT
jgi:hypothetical protein